MSGTIRFSLASPASAIAANDLPLDVAVALALTGGTYPTAPSCSTEAVKTVSYTSAGTVRTDDVPIGATPAFLGLASWSETGDRHAVYHCLVRPLPDGRCPGEPLSCLPAGRSAPALPITASAATPQTSMRAARSTPTPASGRLQRRLDAARRPELPRRPGSEPCPVGASVRITGAADDVFIDTTTLAHQP